MSNFCFRHRNFPRRIWMSLLRVGVKSWLGVLTATRNGGCSLQENYNYNPYKDNSWKGLVFSRSHEMSGIILMCVYPLLAMRCLSLLRARVRVYCPTWNSNIFSIYWAQTSALICLCYLSCFKIIFFQTLDLGLDILPFFHWLRVMGNWQGK